MLAVMQPIETWEGWCDGLRKTPKLILVEGEKDQQALARLEITNTLTVAKKSPYKVIEEICARAREVIILTDLDREGKKYYAILKHHLQRNGVKIDTVFREFLFHAKVTCIESVKEDLF